MCGRISRIGVPPVHRRGVGLSQVLLRQTRPSSKIIKNKMVQSKGDEGGEKVVDDDSETAVYVLELFDRWRLGDVENAMKNKPAQECPWGGEADDGDGQG